MDTSPPPCHSAPGAKNVPPVPKPFHVSDPFLERGLWCFWLTADESALQFVGHLPCVLSISNSGRGFIRRPNSRVLIELNPRYDHKEAWSWVCELLESDTRLVELEETWESAIETAFEDKDEAG